MAKRSIDPRHRFVTLELQKQLLWEQQQSKEDTKVGALVISIHHKNVQSVGCNQVIDGVLYHAEQIAISEAQKKLTKEDLQNCVLAVTHQPCFECAKLIRLSGIRKVYFSEDNKIKEKWEPEKSLEVLDGIWAYFSDFG
jgi:tRNA(Arg) A34 adenosine deaminase TadA